MNAPLPFPALTGDPDPEVTDGLQLRNGVPLRYLSNVAHILERDPRLQGRLRRNTRLDAVELADAPDQDPEFRLRMFFERVYGLPVSAAMLRDALRHTAPPWDPITDHLDGLTWDGEPRIDSLFEAHFGVEPSPLSPIASRRFLIGLIARARTSHARLGGLPVLCGPGGQGTTAGVAALLPQAAWSASMPARLAARRRVERHWLVELEELRPADLSRAQPLLDDGTLGCALLATTDADVLFDPAAGAPPVWLLRQTGSVDPEAIARDRDQLLAEADAAFRAGEPWRLDTGERTLQAEQLRGWREPDAWEGILAAWVERHGTGFTTERALQRALEIAPERQTRRHQMRAGRALRALGMVTVRPRVEGAGVRRRVYVWPGEVEGGGPG